MHAEADIHKINIGTPLYEINLILTRRIGEYKLVIHHTVNAENMCNVTDPMVKSYLWNAYTVESLEVLFVVKSRKVRQF